MSDLSYEQQLELLTGTDAEMLRRAMRTLLSRTFLVKAKDRSLYQFAVWHRSIIELSLRAAGYQLFVDEDYGICMLRDEGEYQQGFSAINRKSFLVRESVMYCVLAWLFMRKMNDTMDMAVAVSVKEIMQTLEQFEIHTGYRTPYNMTAVRDLMKNFERYNLVEIKGIIGDPECVIVLYPTLMFGLDLEEMRKFLTSREDTFRGAAKSGTAGEKSVEDEEPDDEESEEELQEDSEAGGSYEDISREDGTDERAGG